MNLRTNSFKNDNWKTIDSEMFFSHSYDRDATASASFWICRWLLRFSH